MLARALGVLGKPSSAVPGRVAKGVNFALLALGKLSSLAASNTSASKPVVEDRFLVFPPCDVMELCRLIRRCCCEFRRGSFDGEDAVSKLSIPNLSTDDSHEPESSGPRSGVSGTSTAQVAERLPELFVEEGSGEIDGGCGSKEGSCPLSPLGLREGLAAEPVADVGTDAGESGRRSAAAPSAGRAMSCNRDKLGIVAYACC